jgi:hypothetical protein
MVFSCFTLVYIGFARLDAVPARFCLNDVLLTGWGAQRRFCSRPGWCKVPAVSLSWETAVWSGLAMLRLTKGKPGLPRFKALQRSSKQAVHFIIRSLETLKGCGHAQTLRWLSAWLSAQKRRVGDKVAPWECEGTRDLSSFLEPHRKPWLWWLCSLTLNRFTRWSVVAGYDKKKDAAFSALPWYLILTFEMRYDNSTRLTMAKKGLCSPRLLFALRRRFFYVFLLRKCCLSMLSMTIQSKSKVSLAKKST